MSRSSQSLSVTYPNSISSNSIKKTSHQHRSTYSISGSLDDRKQNVGDCSLSGLFTLLDYPHYKFSHSLFNSQNNNINIAITDTTTRF